MNIKNVFSKNISGINSNKIAPIYTPREIKPNSCCICKSSQIRFKCNHCNGFLCSSICSDKHQCNLNHREKQ